MSYMKYKIAELNVKLNTTSERLLRQSEAYACDFFGEVDIDINLKPELLLDRAKKNPELTPEQIEYLWTGFCYNYKLVGYKGLMLHSSAIEYEGKAYLFSAPCGTGKSTHTSLWKKCFGEDNVKIINDDKPAIRCLDQGIFAYGTPWCGKTDQNSNIKVPLGAIVFIQRSDKNWIRCLEVAEAVKNILWQTSRPNKKERMELLLQTVEHIIKEIPIYMMGCNMSEDAAVLARDTIAK